jgi:hypothetical protein
MRLQETTRALSFYAVQIHIMARTSPPRRFAIRLRHPEPQARQQQKEKQSRLNKKVLRYDSAPINTSAKYKTKHQQIKTKCG